VIIMSFCLSELLSGLWYDVWTFGFIRIPGLLIKILGEFWVCDRFCLNDMLPCVSGFKFWVSGEDKDVACCPATAIDDGSCW
jgi:hypothetical protein